MTCTACDAGYFVNGDDACSSEYIRYYRYVYNREGG